jgi:hypothetical protein
MSAIGGKADISRTRAIHVAVWNLLTSQTFSFGASLLHIEVAQVSIGAHNEYFLHHRRRRRSACYCRILWSARLNKKFGELTLKHRDPSSSSLMSVTDTAGALLAVVFVGFEESRRLFMQRLASTP